MARHRRENRDPAARPAELPLPQRTVQEDFLVLHLTCIAILDGKEHRLRQWDFVHCPAGTEHVFVGAGEAPCAMLMIGSRRLDQAHYPVNEVAAKYGASAQTTTDD